MDQADRLRALAHRSGSEKTRVISVTGGKGGVGKSSVAVNMALNFARKGLRTLLVDADFGLANADVMLGVRATKTLDDVLHADSPLEDVIVPTSHGLDLLPSGSGVRKLLELDNFEQRALLDRLGEITQRYDIVIYDTAPGISNHVLNFNAAAHDIMIVTHPEPAALTDAYALIKVLAQERREKKFRLLVNRTRNADEGLQAFKRLTGVCDEFLNVSIDFMGGLPEDTWVGDCARRQKPVSVDAPRSAFSSALGRICDKLLATSFNPAGKQTWNNGNSGELCLTR